MVVNFQNSIPGMEQARWQFNNSASRISQINVTNEAGKEPVQLEKEIINIMKATTSMEANAAVFKAEDKMLGTILDILA